MAEISQERPYKVACRTYKNAVCPSWVLGTSYWICHFFICLIYSGMSLDRVEDQFLYLDSHWYRHIAENGYVPRNIPTDGPNSVFAFYPLWPMLLRSSHFFLQKFFPIQFTGALLAQIFFFATLLIIGQRKIAFDKSFPSEAPKPDQYPQGLIPKTWTGLALLCFSPGAWVFFSNHT